MGTIGLVCPVFLEIATVVVVEIIALSHTAPALL